MKMAVMTKIAVLLVPLPFLAGCGHKETVVGKWQTAASQPGASVHAEFNFMADGKETMMLQQSKGPRTVTINGSGTYTVSGSALTQNITSLTMDGKAVPRAAGQDGPKTSSFTLDGDNLTLTDPATNKSVTLTRVTQ